MKKISFWIIIIIFITTIIFGLIDIVEYENFWSIRNKDYPDIKEFNNVKGILSSFTTDRGGIYFVLDSNKQFSTTDSRNYLYDPPYLDEFFKIGDTIIKMNSDSLFIHRGKNEYYFILGSMINK